MTQGSSFNARYLVGVAALALLAGVAGVALTGEHHTGFVGFFELGAVLTGVFLIMTLRRGNLSPPGWPRPTR